MKKNLPAILFSSFLFLIASSTAQTVSKPTIVSGPKFKVDGNIVIITYQVASPGETPLIISGLVLKDDNNLTFSVTPKTAYLRGDYGKISGAKSGTILWDYKVDIGGDLPPSNKYYFLLSVDYDPVSEEKSFNTAKAQNSITSLTEYLKSYPNGAYASEANTIIQKLKNEKNVSEDNAAWNNTRNSNTIESIDNYLYNYPLGLHVQEAKEIRKNLADKLYDQYLAEGNLNFDQKKYGKAKEAYLQAKIYKSTAEIEHKIQIAEDNYEKSGPLRDVFGIGPLMRMHDFNNLSDLSIGGTFYLNPLAALKKHFKVEPLLNLEVSLGAGLNKITPKQEKYFKGAYAGVGFNVGQYLNGQFIGDRGGNFDFQMRDPNIQGIGYTYYNNETVGYNLVDSVKANSFKRNFYFGFGIMPGFRFTLHKVVRLQFNFGSEIGYTKLSANETSVTYVQRVRGDHNYSQTKEYVSTLLVTPNNSISYNIFDLYLKASLAFHFAFNKQLGMYLKGDFGYCPLSNNEAFYISQYGRGYDDSGVNDSKERPEQPLNSSIKPNISHENIDKLTPTGSYLLYKPLGPAYDLFDNKSGKNYLSNLKGKFYVGVTIGIYISVKKK